MYISCRGITREGVFCQNVEVELDITRGLFYFLIVGLADKCIGESRERIMSAIKNSGFDSPKTKNHKITVSLVPAGIKKEGVLLDLPISIAYLTAAGKLNKNVLENSIFIGELGLDGSIKQNDSLALVVSSILKNEPANTINLYSNFDNKQIELINRLKLPNIRIFKFQKLSDLIEGLGTGSNKNEAKILNEVNEKQRDNETYGMCGVNGVENYNSVSVTPKSFEIDEIIGQNKAKRAILISLCGKFNIIMAGPPGIGKTKLARCMHQLLPTPRAGEYLEILSIHNKLERPFRSPHHTSSYASIIGGGSPITAGEITKAHKGILFLDELPEFNKNIIECLRQPLEQKTVQINRTGGTLLLPCDVICVCAMNLCPCGKTGVPGKECICGGNKINLYKQKVSEPFIERFQISINLLYENKGLLKNRKSGAIIVTKSCDSMLKGEKMASIVNNFDRTNVIFEWKNSDLETLYNEAEKRSLSMRSIEHIKKISETICLIERIQKNELGGIATKKNDSDIEIKVEIETKHLIEAFSYKENLLS